LSELGSSQFRQKNICRHPDLSEGLAVLVDLERPLKFPNNIAATTL